MSRLHYATKSTGPLSTALCGILGSAITDDHAAVTCRLCMTALADQKVFHGRTRWDGDAK